MKRRNNNPDASLSIGTTVTIDKANAELILLGAMLREPFNVYQYPFSETAFKNASNGLAPVFLEILNQMSKGGTFSVTTINAATGNKSVFSIATQNADVDLAWAFEHYTAVYQAWASMVCLSNAIHKVSIGQFNDTGVFEAALNEVAAMRESLGASGVSSVNNGAQEFAEDAMNKLAGNEPVYKTTAPTLELSKFMKAFKPGYLTLIAARPGMGKTQFACNILSHFADSGAKGVFFSLEMSQVDLRYRLLGIRHGLTNDADWSTLDSNTVTVAVHDIASMPINIIDDVFTLEQMESTCLALHAKGELDYMMVDYLQLAKTGRNYGSRNDEIGAISGFMVRMSKRFKIPVIALSQLSRDVEKRAGSKRPTMSDLRDSGSLEQDAANILMLYRDEYYGIMMDENCNDTKGVAEVIVAKHRNGRTGTAIHRYNPIRGYRDPATEIPGPSMPSAPKVESFEFNRPEIGQTIPF